MPMHRLFVANRGEIAVRVIRAAQSLGIETVLGLSAADRDSLGARMATRAVVLGGAAATRSYLNMKLVVHAALATGCDAIHPGYGFLSERSAFAELCEQEGLIFVGPRPETIHELGDKLRARAIAVANSVPVVPGTGRIDSAEAAREAAEEIGFPVVMKASAGGGGRGMFVAESPRDIASSFDRASQEALAAFGDGTLYMERYVRTARHVEVQVLGDGKGKVLHFGERDCSIQRRYQKLVEEAPCTAMPDDTRKRLHAAAVKLCAALDYRNAGTVEFLYDVERDEFHFIEVNARIQVEHPVSECISGEDLVAHQLRIAAGEALDIDQAQVSLSGHAIEYRINAEDPDRAFSPAPGRITRWEPPRGEHIRLDSHCQAGYLVPPFYDSLIGKLIVRGDSREEVVRESVRALEDFSIEGIRCNLELQRFIAAHADFADNRLSTRWLEQTGLPEFIAREERH